MKKVSLLLLLTLFLNVGCTAQNNNTTESANPSAPANQTGTTQTERPETADDALKDLLEGNNRYIKGESIHQDNNASLRTELSEGQHPFAMVLSCSDSRVPPEIVFDQGLGDLFVARVAGNVASDEVVGSLEYGAEHLNVPLIMVLGHEKCGAVGAAVQGGEAHGHIGSLIQRIAPAVSKARQGNNDEELLDKSVRENVKLVTGQLINNQPILGELIQQGKLKVVGARYDMDSGKVEVLE